MYGMKWSSGLFGIEEPSLRMLRVAVVIDRE
jgi:hypothetical protein